MKGLRDADLILACVLAFLVTAGYLLDLPWTVRLVPGLLMVLGVPGYLVADVVSPRYHTLQALERASLAVGLSIATVPLMALTLNALWELSPASAVIGTALLSSALAVAAWIGRRSRTAKSPAHDFVRWRPAALVLPLLVLGIAVSAFYVLSRPQPPTPFTEFSLVSANGEVGDYTTDFIVGSEQGVAVALRNNELVTAVYHIEGRIDGDVVGQAGPITLAAGEGWSGTVSITPATRTEHSKLELRLYKDNSVEVYRNLYLFIRVQ